MTHDQKRQLTLEDFAAEAAAWIEKRAEDYGVVGGGYFVLVTEPTGDRGGSIFAIRGTCYPTDVRDLLDEQLEGDTIRHLPQPS